MLFRLLRRRRFIFARRFATYTPAGAQARRFFADGIGVGAVSHLPSTTRSKRRALTLLHAEPADKLATRGTESQSCSIRRRAAKRRRRPQTVHGNEPLERQCGSFPRTVYGRSMGLLRRPTASN